MPPELFTEDGVYSFASDFWGLGCVLHELATGKPPFTSNSFNELVQMILGENFPPLETNSESFRSIIDSLLQKSPEDRISWPVSTFEV
jgi:serine/threonine-protein kinase ULK4